jgi:hypothetical protein
MSHNLRVGDRVRVTVQNRQAGYLPGEVGEVVAGPEALPGDRRRYYLVRMPRWGHFAPAVFAEGEIEFVGGQGRLPGRGGRGDA